MSAPAITPRISLRNHPCRSLLAAYILLLLLPVSTTLATAQQYVFPGERWERIADPGLVGYDPVKLDSLHAYVEGLNTTAVMVVVGGRVLFEHGDVEQVSYLASVRKSILAMLYGNYVEDGTIDLQKTLTDLEMDDVGGLLPIERRAKVWDLITARSGVYHPASNPGDNLADAPPRGSQEP
ncbi:serine hydrolase, partial [Gemmatimonadota bacterium]